MLERYYWSVLGELLSIFMYEVKNKSAIITL